MSWVCSREAATIWKLWGEVDGLVQKKEKKSQEKLSLQWYFEWNKTDKIDSAKAKEKDVVVIKMRIRVSAVWMGKKSHGLDLLSSKNIQETQVVCLCWID